MFEDGGQLHKKIIEFNELYRLSERAYKSVQLVVLQIDDKIHNEFRYCARGLMELMAEITSDGGSEEEALGKLQRANHAIRNALNDSIDLVVGYASTQIRMMNKIDTGRHLSSFIPNLTILNRSIGSISEKISGSRGNTESRIAIYSEILDSDEFKMLIEFCLLSDEIYSHVRVENINLLKKDKRYFITTAISIGLFIFGIPKFVEFIFKIFPNLHFLGLENYF
jgi:hypothetical protein